MQTMLKLCAAFDTTIEELIWVFLTCQSVLHFVSADTPRFMVCFCVGTDGLKGSKAARFVPH